MKKQTAIDRIECSTARGAWGQGVKRYAVELLESLDGDELPPLGELRRTLLSGADDWSQYSYGGCSLIYDGDIADRLCTPKGLARKRGGELAPGGGKTWLDVQADALGAAARLIAEAVAAYEYERR